MQTKGDVVFGISSSGHCSDTLYHNYNGQFKIYDALHNLLSYFKLGFFFNISTYWKDEHFETFSDTSS